MAQLYESTGVFDITAGQFEVVDITGPSTSLKSIRAKDMKTIIADHDNNDQNIWWNVEVSQRVTCKYIRHEFRHGVEENHIYTRREPYRFYMPPSSHMDNVKIILQENLNTQLHLGYRDSEIARLSQIFITHMCQQDDVVLAVEFECNWVQIIRDIRAENEELINDKMSMVSRIKYCGKERTCSTCAICLDDFMDGLEIVRTPCAHLFHDVCLRTWLAGKNYPNAGGCPMCRTSFFPLTDYGNS